MPEYADQVSLLDYLAVVWKRKWQIVVPAVLLALAAGIVSFLLPSQWDVQALIQPGVFIMQTEDGRLEEIVVVDPRQIERQINEEAYNQTIAADMGLELRQFPKLRAEKLNDTNLIKVSTREKNVERGKAVIAALFDNLKRAHDQKVNVEMKVLETQIDVKNHESQENEINIKNLENEITSRTMDIQSWEIEKARKQLEIETDQNRLEISVERAQSIREEMKSVKKRVEEIDAHLQKALADDHVGSDAVGLLLYSNEIQQNLRFLNTLDESLSREKNTQEDLRLSIQDNKEKIRQIDTEIHKIKTQMATHRNEISRAESRSAMLRSEIALLKEKRTRIDYATLIKPPTASLDPVSPNLKINVVIAGMIGLMIFTILAFLVEFMGRHKTGMDRRHGNP